MCTEHTTCIPEDRPRILGTTAQIYVRVDDYGRCDDLYEENGFAGVIIDRWVEMFDDQDPDDEPAEYVYVLRSFPAAELHQEFVVRERWLS